MMASCGEVATAPNSVRTHVIKPTKIPGPIHVISKRVYKSYFYVLEKKWKNEEKYYKAKALAKQTQSDSGVVMDQSNEEINTTDNAQLVQTPRHSQSSDSVTESMKGLSDFKKDEQESLRVLQRAVVEMEKLTSEDHIVEEVEFIDEMPLHSTPFLEDNYSLKSTKSEMEFLHYEELVRSENYNEEKAAENVSQLPTVRNRKLIPLNQLLKAENDFRLLQSLFELNPDSIESDQQLSEDQKLISLDHLLETENNIELEQDPVESRHNIEPLNDKKDAQKRNLQNILIVAESNMRLVQSLFESNPHNAESSEDRKIIMVQLLNADHEVESEKDIQNRKLVSMEQQLKTETHIELDPLEFKDNIQAVKDHCDNQYTESQKSNNVMMRNPLGDQDQQNSEDSIEMECREVQTANKPGLTLLDRLFRTIYGNDCRNLNYPILFCSVAFGLIYIFRRVRS